MINSINASMGYSGFQIRMGHSPHVIPPLVSGIIGEQGTEQMAALDIISQIEADIANDFKPMSCASSTSSTPTSPKDCCWPILTVESHISRKVTAGFCQSVNFSTAALNKSTGLELWRLGETLVGNSLGGAFFVGMCPDSVVFFFVLELL
ncbi:hypothetical protein L208DRAFT_1339054 [Tricholoma matsutake]|nr:hypothetical protein L208DRAFT_1339054 [Tricholoma matsutake 945]